MTKCFDNSLMCFSPFPMKGEILLEILLSLNMGIIQVKEFSCWKFLIKFKTKEECKKFEWNRVRDWVKEVRNPTEEDLVIQRQEVIEVRGLPLNY